MAEFYLFQFVIKEKKVMEINGLTKCHQMLPARVRNVTAPGL